MGIEQVKLLSLAVAGTPLEEQKSTTCYSLLKPAPNFLPRVSPRPHQSTLKRSITQEVTQGQHLGTALVEVPQVNAPQGYFKFGQVLNSFQ
jgi:hypothetical protein